MNSHKSREFAVLLHVTWPAEIVVNVQDLFRHVTGWWCKGDIPAGRRAFGWGKFTNTMVGLSFFCIHGRWTWCGRHLGKMNIEMCRTQLGWSETSEEISVMIELSTGDRKNGSTEQDHKESSQVQRKSVLLSKENVY